MYKGKLSKYKLHPPNIKENRTNEQRIFGNMIYKLKWNVQFKALLSEREDSAVANNNCKASCLLFSTLNKPVWKETSGIQLLKHSTLTKKSLEDRPNDDHACVKRLIRVRVPEHPSPFEKDYIALAHILHEIFVQQGNPKKVSSHRPYLLFDLIRNTNMKYKSSSKSQQKTVNASEIKIFLRRYLNDMYRPP